jgi:hypothetical protein
MKCLSLWQPWATLVAIGAKQCETRSWETLYRGPIAIHAAKKRSRELRNLCLRQNAGDDRLILCLRQNAGDADRLITESLPFGAIIAVATLSKCERIDPLTTPMDDQERAFGDYTTGRFRWDLDNVRALHEPIPFKGHQGLFDIPDSLIERSSP